MSSTPADTPGAAPYALGGAQLDAPVALVTGSTRGIGRATALRLAADGFRVALNYRADHAAAADALAAVRRVAPDALAVPADVADPGEARRLVAAVVDAWGRLDVLVNNAGPMIEASASATEPETWRAMVEGNAGSAHYVALAALPHLRAVGGRIVNMGSLNAELARGADDHAAYNAAKAALVVMTRSLARSEGRHGVRVNMVSPGIIVTDETPERVRRTMPSRIPLGRLGTPEDVAEAVAFLVGERAAYISGAVLAVSGGLWA